MRNSANSRLRSPASSRSANDSWGAREHAVHFYESDAVLVEAVRKFLVTGLEAGEPCIIIATEAHRQGFCLALATHGVDVELARGAGRLTLFDARETLDRIVVNGVPDTERFRREAIAILDDALSRSAGRRIRLYGEMVDLLWRAGNRSGALQLEELWNDLAHDYDYSMLCGYVFGNFYKASDAEHFERICRVHSHIVDEDLAKAVDSGQEILELTLLRQRASALAYEVEQRKELEQSLRQAVSDRRGAEEALREKQHLLETITNELPVLVSDVGTDKVGGYSSLVADISERKRLEAARAADAERTERLMRITAAIAEAVTEEQVLGAIVDQTAAALAASTVGLWTTDLDGRNAVLLRCFGYPEGARRRFSEAPLDAAQRFPALDVLRDGKPIFIASQAELLERYPHLAAAVTKGRSYCIGCLPVAVEGSRPGAIVFTFDDAPPIDEDQQKLLLLIARYSGQALARLHLLEAERRNRALAEASAARTSVLTRRAELLHGLAKAIILAERVEPVFDAALDAIEHALGTSRASILVLDPDGVMRFKAWRQLSDEYRRAVEGHTPWSCEERAPEPIVVPDVAVDPTLEAYRALFQREKIGALAFIPLVASGRLVGKFMVYYPEPRELRRPEIDIARAIANHVAAALARFAAVDELRETVHFNETFTGILGHDLRNPLGAIMTAAELALKRDESERLVKPLSRIVTSGARMARMIDQLLDFTRVRVGAGIPIAPRPLDLSIVIRQVMDELDDTHPECPLRLELAGDTNGVWDADRLSQVFSNLVANAVQHGILEHGVSVRIDGTSSAQVRVDVQNAGKIPQEVLPRVFEPMTGVSPRHKNAQGLGLGLFISQQILKAHGGRIDVQSNDLGTTFTVSLPRLAPQPANGTS